MRQVKAVEEVFTGKHVDCYVSTDVCEVEDILRLLGYYNASPKRDGIIQEYEVFFPADFSAIYPALGLTIEGVDIPLDEAVKRRKGFGFMAMSKFRIYLNGSNTTKNEVGRLIKSLDGERQNMAFVNDSYQSAFVKLSEFYI